MWRKISNISSRFEWFWLNKKREKKKKSMASKPKILNLNRRYLILNLWIEYKKNTVSSLIMFKLFPKRLKLFYMNSYCCPIAWTLWVCVHIFMVLWWFRSGLTFVPVHVRCSTVKHQLMVRIVHLLSWHMAAMTLAKIWCSDAIAMRISMKRSPNLEAFDQQWCKIDLEIVSPAFECLDATDSWVSESKIQSLLF